MLDAILIGAAPFVVFPCVGMRPGERLYQETFFSHEVAEPTEHPKILRSRNGQHHVVGDDLQISMAHYLAP